MFCIGVLPFYVQNIFVLCIALRFAKLVNKLLRWNVFIIEYKLQVGKDKHHFCKQKSSCFV